MAVKDIRAAKRYATALFGAAQNEKKLEKVVEDINTTLELVQQTPALRQMWESPLIPSGRKRELMLQLFGTTFDTLTLSFLRLLVDKRREDILEAVQMELQHLNDANNHLVRAEATFALEPTPDEISALASSLQKRTGENVQLSVLVDSSILGGVVVRMQDTIIDGSVRGTLERLREQLLIEA